MLRAVAATLVALACAPACAREALYAASVRSGAIDNSSPVAGNLYTVDLGSATYKLVGPIRAVGSLPIGVTGLSDLPGSHVLYGITSENSPAYAQSLVTIDLASAEAKVIGGLGAAGSDIAFDRAGRLFVWLRETSQLGVVDLATGAATALGSPGAASQTGGLAIDAAGTIYLAATGAAGTLDRLDPRTGARTRGPQLSGAPFPGGINSLTVAPDGALLAVNTNLGTPASTVLVRIDPTTGFLTQLAPLPNDTDALLFANVPWTFAAIIPARNVLMPASAAIILAAALFALHRSARAARRS